MTRTRRHLEHVDHLREFFQVPQAKRRRRLLLVLIPSLIIVAACGAWCGLKESLQEIWEDWREAWDIQDPDPNWNYKRVELKFKLPETDVEIPTPPPGDGGASL